MVWVAFISFLAGAGVAGVIARALVVRHMRRVRVAERRARAAEHLAQVGAMTGGLAHEIKNPLSTIGLNAQLLAEAIADAPLEGDERSRLMRRTDALRRESERLRGILTDFLSYAGELRLDRQATDLNQLVEELVDFFLPQAERHGVRLRADLAPGELVVDLDGPHVKQALLNLMLNALQAMRPDGEPSRDGDRPAPGDIILRTARAREEDGSPTAQVHVIDTGPGIPAETLGKVFEPYFTTKRGGTGLGLPTTRRIVEAHGGRLSVHSEAGKGTDVGLIFPVDSGAVG